MLKAKSTQLKIIQLGVFSLILMAVFLGTSIEAAKVYTWKDASGVTHFSDKPFPQAKNSKTIEIKAARPNVESSKSTEKANESAAKNELINPSDSKRLKAECNRARNNLVTLASGKIIRRTNAEGEQETLDEAGIQAEVQQNQSFINANCRAANINGNPSNPSSSTDSNGQESLSEDL